MTVAVVTPVHGRRGHLLAQRRTLLAGSEQPDLHVLAAMDDPDLHGWSPDGIPVHVVPVPADARGLPLAAARNAGVEAAIAAGADVVIGLDVDCLAGSELVAAYSLAVRRHPLTAWIGPVTYLPEAGPDGYDLDSLAEADDPHPAQPSPVPGTTEALDRPEHFWSLSFALSSAVWRVVGGFCEEYVGYGVEDTDFGRLLGRSGVPIRSTGSARAYHQHHPVESPPVRHVADLVRNGRTYADRWGEWPAEGWFTELERLGHVVRRGRGWALPPG